ncbi:MAG TPA: hypothetical protein VN380_23365 [Thermoanaerobaculia bacterium]|jgi:hypothetical protein|nr:hypothetical protein [Thermoanaerobaculia bacterium]
MAILLAFHAAQVDRLPHTLVALFVVIALGCNARQEFPKQRPFEPDPETAAEVTDDDMAVFETVIAAYATSGEVLGLGPPPPGRPSSSPDPPQRPLSPADVARFSNEHGLEMLASTRRCGEVRRTGWWDFAGLRAQALELPRSAAADFDRRNAHSVALDRFRPKYLTVMRTREISRVSISVELPDERKRKIEVPGRSSSGYTVVFTLPGYSRTRDVAVVEVSSFAPAPYGGGSEFVFLRRSSGGWRAIAKHVGCVS